MTRDQCFSGDNEKGTKMNTATIYKEEFENPAIWATVIRELELPPDTDEITVKCISYMSESKRKESRKNKS